MRNISGKLSSNNKETPSVPPTNRIQPIRLEIQLRLLRSFTPNGPRTFEASSTSDLYLLMMKIQNILNKINILNVSSELRAEPDLIMFVALRGSLFH